MREASFGKNSALPRKCHACSNFQHKDHMRAPCRPWISPLAHRSIIVEVYPPALQLLIIHRLLTLRLCAL